MLKGILVILMALVLDAETNNLYLTLSPEVRRAIDAEIMSISKQINNNVDKLVLDIDNFIEARIGLSEAEILSQLKILQTEGSGLFGTIANEMSKAVANKTFSISEDVFFADLKSEEFFAERASEEFYMWQAMLVNTCPDCLELHGTVDTMANWKADGVPNQRNTVCTIHGKCHCILVPDSVLPDNADMRTPIKIQAERIRRAEIKRGKDYAPSTKQSFLGQINNPNSTVYDLRKIKKIT